MSYTITVLNSTQNNFLPVVVNAIPLANPEDLIWTPSGTGTTTAGVAGTIFPGIILDQVDPGAWYHGGNPIIDTGTLDIHGCDIVEVANTETQVISDTVQKGIFEIRTGISSTITSTVVGTTTQIDISSLINIPVGGYIEILDVTNIPNGYYKIVSILGTPSGYNSFLIDFDSSLLTLTVLTTATATPHNYYWDEVYTTPLGLYAARDSSVVNPAFYEFRVSGNDSEFLTMYVDDPNIIPKIGDSFVIQRFFQTVNSFTNTSTTDGLNNVPTFLDTETYVFEITGVSALSNPLVLPVPYVEYTLTLDKSFAPIIALTGSEKYMMVLLNRAGTTPNRELITDTWLPTEVHREQLLGDPYEYSGITLPAGRKNYLNYKGAERLGFQQLLSGILDTKKTPFLVLDFQDEVKDRVYEGLGEVEVHYPTIMLQSERGPIVLNNSNPLGVLDPIFQDTSGAGSYGALYMKYPTVIPAIRYGWVMYDLRIVVIDHPELVFALSYNGNRNYSLPAPTIASANALSHSTPASPLLITNTTITTPITVTTTANHNLEVGDAVFVQGVLGNVNANTIGTTPYYADVISLTQFNLYSDITLTTPVAANPTDVYTGGGITYGQRLPYEYFLTYRLKGVHYKTLPYAEIVPFNFEQGGALDTGSSSQIALSFDKLSHLVDYDATTNPNGLQEGFEADEYEVIIGKYKQSLLDPYTISGIEDIVLMGAESLKNVVEDPFILNAQNTIHTASYIKAMYDGTVAFIPGPPNPEYDLLNNTDELIYNVTSLPSTLFASEGIWNIGVVQYKEVATQYKLRFQVVVPAEKWNSTYNPSFEAGNILMNDKFISEIEFLIDDPLNEGTPIDQPYVYAKIAPVIKKTNTNDIVISVEIDF